MQEQKYSVGTQVRLKSGGPLMVIGNYVEIAKVQCTWFNKDEHFQATFHEEQLVEIKTQSSQRNTITIGH